MAELPLKEDLERLSLRASIAYAARCTRRVQPLCRSLTLKHRQAIERAIALAESFVGGEIPAPSAVIPAMARVSLGVADAAAAAAADVTAEAVVQAAARTSHVLLAGAAGAENAAAAASAAIDAAAEDAVRVAEAARHDFEYLLSNHPRGDDPLGEQFEISEMGLLWPNGEPQWYTDANETKGKHESRGDGLPVEEDLRRLSSRAIVAYAARCARRVQALCHSDDAAHLQAIERAIVIAERFAQGADLAAADMTSAASSAVATEVVGYAGNAAVNAAYTAANVVNAPSIVATSASATAVDAANAIDDHALRVGPVVHVELARISGRAALIVAARSDFSYLMANHPRGDNPLGAPIDLSAMGPLWPEGEPEWFKKSNEPPGDVEQPEVSQIAGPLRVYIDSDAYTPEEKGELLSLISDLYSLQTGDRLVIDSTGTAEPVPVGISAPDGGQS